MSSSAAELGQPDIAGIDALLAGWSEAATPPPALTVSEWADAERMLPETSGARGGRWRTDSTPYLRGLMDVVHEPGVKTVAVKKSAQVGGSEALHNIVGYHIKYDPCSMLLVHPTEGVAEEWSKERLADMLRTSPAIGGVVDRTQSTLLLKMFEGGMLVIGGANTPNTFARRSARIAMGDDVDRFPAVVGEEGDPADLLEKRTTTYVDPLILMVSTPTLKGARIDVLYERSDQRRYVVACPHCGREDYLTWSDAKHFHVRFDARNPDTARIQCPEPEAGGCGAAISEPQRRAIILEASRRADKGWRATAVAKERGLVGFHLSALLSTLGSVTIQSLVEGFLSAKAKGKEALRVFINTMLGEAWEDRTTGVEAHTLLERCELYGDEDEVEVPAKAVALTAGVDVQDNRFELQVMGWGLGGERWVVDYRVIPGDPKKQETRDELWKALQRKYTHASGHLLPIHATCIDSGYATDEIYGFVLKHEYRRVYATKGYAGRAGEPIVGKPSEKRPGKNPRPVRLYPINVDDAKKNVMDAVGETDPGPGAMHWPLGHDQIDEEYFAQLCAEHRVPQYNRKGLLVGHVWVKQRDRNEALDTAVLCLAAYRLFNPNIRQMAEALAATPPPPRPSGSTAPAAPPAPVAAAARSLGRRMSRSSYLGR